MIEEGSGGRRAREKSVVEVCESVGSRVIGEECWEHVMSKSWVRMKECATVGINGKMG